MKTRFYIFLLFLSLSLPRLNAQWITYYHDNPVMCQFLMGETGGSPDSYFQYYYQMWHSDYISWAPASPKIIFRTLEFEQMYKQVPYSETIDTTLTARAKEEALNLADRQVDLTWMVERQKLEDKFEEIEAAIEKVMTAGGTSEVRDILQDKYDCLKCAVNTVHEAYLPNSERKEQYLAIFADAKKLLGEINLALYYYNTKKGYLLYKDGVFSPVLNLGTIASEARARFQSCILKSSNK